MALGLVAICVLLGGYALLRNEVTSQMSFSQILVTTRNATLDTLCEGATMGGEYMDKGLLRTKLRFSKLSGKEHMGFGLESEISPLIVEGDFLRSASKSEPERDYPRRHSV
jgi:hypothetical protein